MRYRAVVALCPLAIIAGCEFSCQVGGLSKDKVEKSIRDKVSEHVDSDFEVTCPKIEKDAVTNCSVALAGGPTFTVEVTSKDGKASYQSKAVFFGKILGPKLKGEVKEKFGLDLEAVTCPAVMLAHKDAEGACEGSAGAVKVPIVLKFGADGAYVFRPNGGVVMSDKAAQLVANRFRAQKIEVKASCGPPAMRLSTPGSEFECTATDSGGKSMPVYFRVTSPTGAVDMSAKPFGPAK